MSTFNEQDHPRHNDGRFAGKPDESANIDLSEFAPSPYDYDDPYQALLDEVPDDVLAEAERPAAVAARFDIPPVGTPAWLSDPAIPKIATTAELRDLDDWRKDSQSRSLNLGLVIARADPDLRERLAEDAAEQLVSPADMEELGDLAYRMGLLPNKGPWELDARSLEKWVADGGRIGDIPEREFPTVIPGRPLSRPLTARQALHECDKDGYLTVTLAEPLEELIQAARGTSWEGDDEDEVLMKHTCLDLPPYDSSYKASGFQDGLVLIEFTTNVRMAYESFGQDSSAA